MHSGRAWGSDTITVTQGERLLSRGLVLLNTVEPDLMRHGPSMPDVPRPDDLPTDAGSLVYPGVETRTVDDAKATAPDGTPAMYFWMRNPESYDSVAANQAILAWSQPGHDHRPRDAPAQPTRSRSATPTARSPPASSRTPAHFHDRFDVGQWLLVAQ